MLWRDAKGTACRRFTLNASSLSFSKGYTSPGEDARPWRLSELSGIPDRLHSTCAGSSESNDVRGCARHGRRRSRDGIVDVLFSFKLASFRFSRATASVCVAMPAIAGRASRRAPASGLSKIKRALARFSPAPLTRARRRDTNGGGGLGPGLLALVGAGVAALAAVILRQNAAHERDCERVRRRARNPSSRANTRRVGWSVDSSVPRGLRRAARGRVDARHGAPRARPCPKVALNLECARYGRIVRKHDARDGDRPRGESSVSARVV